MNKFFGFAAALLLAAMPLLAFAAKIDVQKSVFIPSTQTLTENTYLAGGDITLSSPAQKDLIAVGGRIIVNAPIWGDAFLGGGTVDVLDQVHGDLRVAGGQVTISSPVGGDLIVAGGQVTVNPGVTVAGDVIAAGGEVILNGAVNGQVKLYGGEVTLNANVAGLVTARVGKTLAIGSKAIVGDVLSYTAPMEASVADGAKVGDKVSFTKSDFPALDRKNMAQAFAAMLGFLIVIKFVGVLIAALVMTFGFSEFTLELSKGAVQRFWHMTGLGFVVVIVMPIVAILLALSVFGLYLSFLVGLMYLTLLMVAGIYSCILAGALLARLIKKDVRVNWKWTILGTVAMFVLWFIPFVGSIAMCIVFFAATGVVVKSLARDARSKMTMRA